MKATQITLFSPEPKIKRLAHEDKPLYRLERLGGGALAFHELLALLIGGGNQLEIAEAVTTRWATPATLQRACIAELESVYGLGKAAAARIKAAYEIGRRVTTDSGVEKPAIHSPADAAALVQYEMSALEQEELRVFILDVRNRVIDITTVYRGSLNSSQVRVGELFRSAVQQQGAAVIIVHNHPSGDPSPSPDDIALTRSIVQAGNLLDIEVLDHLVIGQGRFVSLKERGLGFG